MFLSIYSLILFCGMHAYAAPDVKTAKATVSAVAEKSHITVSVLPPEGTKLNFDGPWKLKFSETVPVAQKKLGKKEFDKEKKHFKVLMTSNSFSKGDYSLTYFICDKGNTWCKRMVDKGQIVKK